MTQKCVHYPLVNVNAYMWKEQSQHNTSKKKLDELKAKSDNQAIRWLTLYTSVRRLKWIEHVRRLKTKSQNIRIKRFT